MNRKCDIEDIACYNDCYQIDIRFEDSEKLERTFIRRDALFALITVAEKNEIEKVQEQLPRWHYI